MGDNTTESSEVFFDLLPFNHELVHPLPKFLDFSVQVSQILSRSGEISKNILHNGFREFVVVRHKLFDAQKFGRVHFIPVLRLQVSTDPANTGLNRWSSG